MKRVAIGIAAVTLLCLSNAGPALAATLSLADSVQSAQTALEQGQYKRAETTLRKAITQATTEDASLANANVLLARALRQAGKTAKAGEALEVAHTVYKKLGFVEPTYVEELNALSGDFQTVDLNSLGTASTVMKNHSAVISMTKSGGGAHVEIVLPELYTENGISNGKIDGIQMEKLVAFDLEQQGPNAVHVSNVKGFKIHSIEKNMWVNLLDLTTSGRTDSDGKYDAQVTAGKAGITKIVPANLPQRVLEPVLAIANAMQQFGKAAVVDLPVAKAPETVTTVSPTATTEPVAETKPQPVVETKPVPVAETKPQPVVETKSEPVAERKPEPVVEQKPDPVVEQKTEPVVERKPETVVEPKTETRVRRTSNRRTDTEDRDNDRKDSDKDRDHDKDHDRDMDNDKDDRDNDD